MTVKDLRKTLQPYADLIITYGNQSITIAADDPATLEAFAPFLTDTISIKDEETITAALKMRPVKE